MRTTVAAATTTTERILDLLLSGGTPTWGQIKQGPERLNGSEVSRILPRIAWLTDQLARPMQADRAIRPPFEDGHHWNRLAIGTIAAVVAAEAVVRGRQQSDVLPPPVARERSDLVDWGSCDNRQIAPKSFKMGHRAVPSVDKRNAGRTGALRQCQLRRDSSRRSRSLILRVSWEHEMVEHECVAVSEELRHRSRC